MSNTTHYRACNLCEAMCGLEFHLTDGEITSIKPDKDDPFSEGHICPKGVALQDLQNDPDRLRKPMQRTADGWQEIEWDAAFDIVVDKLAGVVDQHGVDAVGAYFGNPNVHNYGSLTHANVFLGHIKTKNRFSATSVDQLPHQLAAFKLFGHQTMVPIPDIDRSQYFLAMGYNPMASNGSLMTVPNFPGRLKALQKRGGKFVVIDPRRSETAKVADEYHAIRPGFDAAFLFAVINTVFAEGLAAELPDYIHGLDDLKQAVADFTPEAVAAGSGISADTIRQIARDFAAADGAVCHPRMGCSTQEFGGITLWAGNMLNIITGNLDKPGGSMFTLPAVDLVGGGKTNPGHFDKWRSRVSNLPEFSGELPASCLLEEMATPGEGQIRALITSAGNPVLSVPNGKALEAELDNLEFMVSFDFYLNETTRHADIILPPTPTLEHDHYDMIFNHFAVRNVTRFNEPVMPKPEGTLHDWEIFTELGKRYAAKTGKTERTLPPPAQLMDMGLQYGPYGEKTGHELGLNLAKLKDHPHGIDLGPLTPTLPERLQTQDKTIQLNDPLYLNDIPRVAAQLQANNDGLLLIGRRHVRSNNSWMHNSHRLVKGKARDQLLMNPSDLADCGVSDGSTVKVKSRVGEIEITVNASDEMTPGVVSIPHGWGHTRDGIRLHTAGQNAGVSVNDITDEKFVDVLSGNAAVNGVPVTVSAA